ncbi:MAG: patatin-like phospholipase family protein [Gammaproteobacteria bacterium]|nr:patatin-like phospholipase family protein [Gammaproteobacteria bacterium]
MLRKPCFKPCASLLIGLLWVSCLVSAAGAETAQGSGEFNGERPRIGLVLAGGGAKGGAHVGVLKVLEGLHVPIDCIAGTSMGALVGAGYASGIPAPELEGFITGINWKSVVGGLGQRDLQPVEQKRAGETYSNSLEVGIQDGSIKLPGGLVNTSGIENLLRTYVARSRMQPNFDRLPIPFRAVATDMVTGEMVVIGRGDIATAMRASMAIPGAFAPVTTDRYILSDGGMVRNIPVDVARELCADVVIVVNLVEPEVKPEKLQTATQLLSRSMDVMIQANEELQLQSLTDRDIRIDVMMGDIGTSDFERVPDTIPLGEEAARLMTDRLRALAVSDAQYLAWREKVTAGQEIDARLTEVRYEGLQRVNPEFLAQRSQVQAGDTVDTAEISAEALRMSALQDFESVEYRLEGDAKEPALVWLPKEKRWGPDYLKMDLGVYASEGGDLGFAVYAKHTRKWINSLGAEWRNQIQLGSETQFSTSFYQPLTISQVFFVEPSAGFYRTLEDVFDDGERIATYEFNNLGGGIDLGVNLSNQAQVRAGYIYRQRDVRVDTGAALLPEGTEDDAGLMVSATFDSRDTPFNATRGMALALEYLLSDDSLGASRDWERVEMGLGMAVPVRKDIVWITVAGGSDLGSDLPADRAFMLGGPGSFPGFELGELRANQYWTASGSYLWQVKDIMSIRGQALYAGFRLQAGETYQRLDLVDEGLIYGGSVYLTGRTQVGPLTVGIGTTSADSWSLWVAVGRPIGHGTILERGIFR